EMGRLDAKGVADESAGRETHVAVRCEGGRMGAVVHPKYAVPFQGLRVPMNRNQRSKFRIAFFPHQGVADGADRIGRHVSVALMESRSEPGRVIGKSPQSAGF